jgi:Tfp pilus assembly protein PilP
MKMKPTVTILVCMLAAGLASAQSAGTSQNTRSTTKTVSPHATAASTKAVATPQKNAPAAASATHAPAKSVAPVVAIVPTAKPKVREHEKQKKAGAVLVVPSALPAAPVVPQEKAPAPVAAASAAVPPVAGSGESDIAPSDHPAPPDSKYSANGRRDPFLSPVVSHEGGSGCSTGKKCLEIGSINLRGVVRTESGFIAVVSNNLNKAYFLRENDPVFNGYVVKITGDSIVFQETLQDRLGKTFTREVTKKITTPAV